ncbi:sulfotransferase [Sediminibacter sp. Hel_I_10]|uniref:sulfotransferase n=1 Tax=Sediminibacter sp. Hel_I_10 TaxID=1392490 RepID=UPI0012DCBAA3|nr:sulfotransferase [Sediminibacter sp. Hel_I_10]
MGFQKTGTTSLEHALQFLDYRVCGGVKHLMDFEHSEDLQEYLVSLLKNWDAFQDMPWPLFYKELYELYPDAKFILTIRPTEQWIKSVVNYFASIRVPLHQKIYKVPCAEGHEVVYKKVYNQHNNDVIAFFKNKPNFIIMKQGLNFDYDTLCGFLNIDKVPQMAFPHARNNKKRQLPNYKLYRDLRSLYWNFKKKY